jgi:hypothetical protein
MGEARRRRVAHERGSAASITWADGSCTHGRAAPAPRALLDRHEALLRRAEAGDRSAVASVPCNGCTACCHIAWVPIDPDQERAEDLQRLDLVANPRGGWMLRKGADGACVHLTREGCGVYAHRPYACRLYDCRTKTLLAGRRVPYGDRTSPEWIFDLRHGEGALAFQILTCAAGEFDAMLARVPDDHDARGNYGFLRLREVWPETMRLLHAAADWLVQALQIEVRSRRGELFRQQRAAVARQMREHMERTAAAAQAAWLELGGATDDCGGGPDKPATANTKQQ